MPLTASRAYFVAVDTNRSGSIDAGELQRALVNGDWTPFDGATIAMLQAQFSGRRTGELVYAEFAALYAYIASWSTCFRRADTDGNGTIDEGEMGAALRSFGFNLDAETLHMLMLRYSPFDSRRGITFDRFVRACVFVKSLTEGFQRFDPQRRGVAQMAYKDFMQTCKCAPCCSLSRLLD